MQQIALELLFTRKDAREINESAVRGLVASISEVGVINPLRVRPARRFVQGVEADAYEVTAGAHRLKAARKIGLEKVPCIVADDDDLHAELAMIDENWARADLTPADRAIYANRRKVIYLQLHPETAHGGNQSPSGQFGHTDAPGFVKATADAVGKSERTIRRDAERGEKITEQALSMLRGTRLDNTTDLDKLKNVEADKQAAWVERRLADPRPAKPVKVAADPLDDVAAQERQVARLMDAWNAAGPDARQEFLARIDTPVFDRSAA